ncbi:MAG: TolC family protein [Treponema sp.]|jgi:outer membrane protein TolC|nr:TolC family protein [Treponema sp.]
MRLSYVLLALLPALSAAGAQTGVQDLTVDAAVRIALDNNLSLQRDALALEGKKRTADRSWNSLIPGVSAGASVNHPTSLTGSIPAEQNVWTPGLSVSASLSLSLSTADTIKKTRIDYEAGLLTYAQARQELEWQVRKLFYQILLLEANTELAVQGLSSAQARYEQSAAFARTGQASHLEAMTARVDLENRRPTVRNAETLYENALDSFKTLLGIPREQEVALQGTIQYAGSGVQNEETRTESLPVAVLQKSIASLEAQRKAARNSAYIPSLRFSWNTTPLYAIDRSQWNDNGSFSVGLSLNLDNLFPGSMARTQIDSLNDSIRSAEIELRETIRNRESRIMQYRRTMEQTKETIAALTLNVELAQTAYALYEEAYRNGAADYQQLREAGDSLLQAQNRVLQEQYNLRAALLDLEKELHVPFGTIH